MHEKRSRPRAQGAGWSLRPRAHLSWMSAAGTSGRSASGYPALRAWPLVSSCNRIEEVLNFLAAALVATLSRSSGRARYRGRIDPRRTHVDGHERSSRRLSFTVGSLRGVGFPPVSSTPVEGGNCFAPEIRCDIPSKPQARRTSTFRRQANGYTSSLLLSRRSRPADTDRLAHSVPLTGDRSGQPGESIVTME